jgi:glycosyltransferase involved in cell wall biosynthesis
MTRRHLRIAMVTTFYPPYHFGGDARAVRHLAHALVRRGHEVDVIHDIDAYRTLGGGDPEPLQEPPGLRVHGLESRLGALSNLATQQSGRPIVHGRTIQRILAGGFDVIHFHNVSLVGGPGVLAYGEAIKLYTAHEHWLVCPTHILWRHNRELCDGRQCFRCQLHYRRPPQLWRHATLLRQKSKNIDAFITFSRFSRDKHRDFGFEPPMTVLPPFLAEVRGKPMDEPTSNPPPYFLFVGRLEAIKGVQDVIPWFAGPGATELWIAGSGSDEARLRRLAEGMPRIRFLGQKTPEALRRLYHEALAVLAPSTCFEVFPMIVLEAFREGKPVIARDLGPFREIAEQSGACLLFATPTELGTILARIEQEPELRQRLGAAGRVALASLWSERVALGRYLDLIAETARRLGRDDIVDLVGRSGLAEDHPQAPVPAPLAEHARTA